MKTKGLHAYNVIVETTGTKWKYAGEIEKEDQHRLQYDFID